MSNSYRIRTQVGVDTSLKVLIDQEFEYLEILSLKILQSDIYTRQCADYGVVVGRVSVNNGFGLPNAKVSIFIPLDSIDKDDPVVSNIYPYSNLYDVNDDGYRYNLLPYKPSYSAHIPTGTFFTRQDVLLSPVLGEIYDKYYKYNAVTNQSGDYMIFGVPVGSHTIVVDVDLSDIGEFSLSPQDLIRMGRATENQVDGTKFRSSTNLGELPQIVSFKRTIEIEPLWGQPEICNLGITRTDFDLTGESNIDIRPTAIFMGSMVSDSDSNSIRRNCKPTRDSGYLCNLITGPGEILAIRQTIQQDSLGRPILESYGLEGGGTIIDTDGTWLVDVPMNLDYYITNEFGEQVLSPDPNKGIPTKGKYRFKVKWAQSPSASAQTKRAYYLVPNIKEWTDVQKSYAFSLDWDDYWDLSDDTMLQEAIDCKDKFYLMQYNKVYTVSQFIGEHRRGGYQQFTGIKNILDEACESENNRYPTNDGYFRFDFFYVLFSFLSIILTPIFFALILLLHLLYFVIWILRVAYIPYLIIYYGIASVNNFVGAFAVGFGATFSAGIFAMGVLYLIIVALLIYILIQLWKMNLVGIQVPILTYPDCSMCSCNQGQGIDENPDEDNGLGDLETGNEDLVPCTYIVGDALSSSPLSLGKPVVQLSSVGGYKVPKTGNTSTNFIYTTGLALPLGPYDLKGSGIRSMVATQFAGKQFDGQTANPGYGVPSPYSLNNGTEKYTWTTTALPIADRINLFNVKAKYFDGGPSNPGGGVNRISVKYDPTRNPGTNQIHYDNTVVILCDKSTLKKYVSGQMIAFQNPSYSKDPNLNSPLINKAGNYAITGITVTGLTTVTVPYANPNGTSGNVPGPTYNVFLTGNTKYNYIYRFPTDVEYFQVITGMTYSTFTGMCNPSTTSGLGYTSLNNRYISNKTTMWSMQRFNAETGLSIPTPMVLKAADSIKNRDLMGVIILNRGVDPYTDKIEIEYGLGKLFGFTNEGDRKITTKCRMNIPIQGKFLNISHSSGDYLQTTVNGVTAGSNVETDSYSNTGQKLYFDSFSFTPQQVDVSGMTVQYNEFMLTADTLTHLAAGYSAFNSNLVSYYSKLDNKSNSFTLQCSNQGSVNPSITTAGKPVPNRGFSVLGGSNWFTRVPRMLPASSPGGTWQPPYLVINSSLLYNINGNNEGYVPNEIVEGSAIMNLSGNYERLTGYWECTRRIIGCLRWEYRWNTPADPVDTLIPYYWSPTYNSTGNTLNFSKGVSGKQLVMRGDRLPTSTVTQEFCCNSWVLQKNANLQVYLIPEKGTVGIYSSAGSSSVIGGGNSISLNDNQTQINGLFNTFTCGGSVNLECYGCYTPPGTVNSTIKIDYGRQYSAGKRIFNKGCYIFITRMFLSLVRDWELMAEWISRNMVMLGACRNVFSHTFNNNWVNGNLYVMPFKNDIVGYTSPTSNPPNAPINGYCLQPSFPVVYHIATKSFYYKCAPYDGDDFSGDIKYPTTMIDLGPRSYFLQEIVMSDEYDGYIANKLNSSTFSHVDEILNLFIVSRFLDNGFIQNLLAGANILAYFQQEDDPRGNLKIDADYAQLISINSELGVAAFQSSNYPNNSDPSKQNPIYFECNGGYLGIFYSSDTQFRDYVTPKRTIIDPTASINNQSCAFSNFPVYSQVVPLSQWEIKTAGSIFGNEGNNWNYDTIYKSKYQSLDRLDVNSRYFRNNGISVIDDKGYIYAVDGAGDLSAGVSNWTRNNPDSQMVTVGAPFHFYFGLKRGKTAYDRFRSKWVNTEITTI
jgi:hypothetical protein